MTKDEWGQKAKALLFDCSYCIDADSIRREINELLGEAGGYNPEIESSKTQLRWPSKVELITNELVALSVALGVEWKAPHVSVVNGIETELEWWYGKKKLSLSVGRDSVEYLQVWGPNVSTDMDDGQVGSEKTLKDLWLWLTTPRQENIADKERGGSSCSQR